MNIKEGNRINAKTLTESQKTEILKINRIITEECGINEEVFNLSKKLADTICKNHENKQHYDITIAGDSKWRLTVEIFDVDKNTDIRSEERDYLGVTYFSYKLISISAYRINGKLKQNKMTEVLSHEILHAYNISMSLKDGLIRSERNRNIYVTAAREAKGGRTELNRYIGYVIYLSNNFETNAFENGLYSYLMSCDLVGVGDEEKAMVETSFYKRLVIIKNANAMINKYPEETEKIISNTYGKTLRWIQKLSKSTLKNCRRQIGRALVKFRKDYDWTHGGKNLITI